MSWISDALDQVTGDRPVLIAGPTASGKSALAMAVAERFGGTVINADALQVFSDWRILTARPSPADEGAVDHALYGYIPGHRADSVGHWLRDITPLLENGLPIVVGGTGLNFQAMTNGLADIPSTPSAVRAEADTIPAEQLLAELDARTKARIDTANRARVQRAWEVLRNTGRGLADWQDDTPPPVLPIGAAQSFVVNGPTDWLNTRIEERFDAMLAAGVVDEATANAEGWHLDLPSAKAIGASELVAYVRSEMSLEQVRESDNIQTRQYAKRQRNWLRGRMKSWVWLDPSTG